MTAIHGPFMGSNAGTGHWLRALASLGPLLWPAEARGTQGWNASEAGDREPVGRRIGGRLGLGWRVSEGRIMDGSWVDGRWTEDR